MGADVRRRAETGGMDASGQLERVWVFVCARCFFVFFKFSLPLPACMSLMVVAYLIIDPKATDPLN